jgi:hypothetical protein
MIKIKNANAEELVEIEKHWINDGWMYSEVDFPQFWQALALRKLKLKGVDTSDPFNTGE